MSRARAPVAMMMLGAVSVRVWSPVVTVSSVALVRVPLPSTTLTTPVPLPPDPAGQRGKAMTCSGTL